MIRRRIHSRKLDFRWHWCITGELTEEENLVSGILASMWTQVNKKKKKKEDDIFND